MNQGNGKQNILTLTLSKPVALINMFPNPPEGLLSLHSYPQHCNRRTRHTGCYKMTPIFPSFNAVVGGAISVSKITRLKDADTTLKLKKHFVFQSYLVKYL